MNNRPAVPTGTVTFLFTDIEGSTQLWEHHPEAMKAALAEHDRILRSAIETHGGYVFKTVGDAFCAAFERAPQALAACLQAQRDLQAPYNGLLIKVRMGFHTGTAEERDGDYFGQTLNRAARLMSAGHGGQTLVSQASQELLRDQLPPGVDLQDLGERRLKDLVRPERMWQVAVEGQNQTFAPLKTLDTFAHNLPVQLSSFVGRELVLLELKAALAGHRLVTLVGPGGTGKTRLSLQVGSDLLERFTDGVWFVELAPVADPELVASVVAQSLGIPEQSGVSSIQAVSAFVRDRNLLIILDNCEHLVESGARVAEALIRAGSRVSVLASSREALGIGGEHSFRVPALAVPDLGKPSDLATFAQYEAVRLFAERARAVRPNFSITLENAPALAQICRRLDGIPLALELAAARTKLLTAEQIAAKLDDLFRLLTGGSRTALPRQQTLQALIDWSWVGLSPDEKTFLARLSVFAGGWTLEAAERVVANDLDGLELLSSLVDKSLVQPNDDDEPRYRLLETVRQFARQKLAESGEAEAVRERHLDWIAELSNEQQGLGIDGYWTWRRRLQAEFDNVRAALDYAEGLVDPLDQRGLAVLSGLLGLIQATGFAPEWQERIERAWARRDPEQKTLLTAKGALTVAEWHGHHGRFGEAEALVRLGLTIGESMGDYIAFRAHMLLWSFEAFQHKDLLAARSHLKAAEKLARNQGWPFDIAWAVWGQAELALYQNRDPAAALPLAEEALAVSRRGQRVSAMAYCLGTLAAVVEAQGDFARALALQEEALELHRSTGDLYAQVNQFEATVSSLLHAGKAVEAQTLLDPFEEVCAKFAEPRYRAEFLLSRACVAFALEHFDEAEVDFAESLRLQTEYPYLRAQNRLGLARVAVVRGDKGRVAALFAEALALEPEPPKMFTVNWLELGVSALRTTDTPTAQTLWGLARAFRQSWSLPAWPAQQASFAFARDWSEAAPEALPTPLEALKHLAEVL